MVAEGQTPLGLPGAQEGVRVRSTPNGDGRSDAGRGICWFAEGGHYACIRDGGASNSKKLWIYLANSEARDLGIRLSVAGGLPVYLAGLIKRCVCDQQPQAGKPQLLEWCHVAFASQLVAETGGLARNLPVEQVDGAAEPGKADSFPGAGALAEPEPHMPYRLFQCVT